VYRRTEKVLIEPNDPEIGEKLEQLSRVNRFFANFHNPDGSVRRSYKSYQTPDEFKKQLEPDLKAVVRRLLAPSSDAQTTNRAPRELSAQVQLHRSVGDRLAAQKKYIKALEEYEKALQIDPGNIEVGRRFISTAKDNLLEQAFGSHWVIGIALRHHYADFRLTSESEIDSALTALYRLQALNPELRHDVALLLDEALILKAGLQLGPAVGVLRQAHELAPAHAAVLAELGLLLALSSEDPPQIAGGIAFIRRAIQAEPNEARYHFYLAHALAETCLCPYAGLEYSRGDDAQACAEAIREYHRAADLAVAGDTWQIRARARECSIDIFHRYARKEGDILTPKLAMPFDERLRELQYLSGSSTSMSGLHDNPRFWLVVLHHATRNLEQADLEMRTLLQEDHDRWLGQDVAYWKDQYYIKNRLLWFELFCRILEQRDTDSEILASVNALMSGR
jgi:tetratricopeptide (TPR) repeat protein